MKKIISFALVAAALVASSASAAVLSQAEITKLKAAGFSIADIMAYQGTATTTAATTTTTTGGYVHAGVTQDFTQYIYFGSRGAEVARLQTALASYGAGAADGIYGNMTKAAVIAFQKATGIGVDGKVGPQTRGELNRKGAATTTPTTPVEGGDVEGDKLVVSGMASDDMIVGAEQKVTFSKITLEAGDKDVDVRDILVEVSGSANGQEVIDQVLLLDSAKLELDRDSVDGDDEAELSADIEVEAGESVVLYIAALTSVEADIEENDGLEISIKVTQVETRGTDVEGDSIEGASHTVQDNIDTGVFEVEIEGEETTAKVGENAVEFATITIDETDNESNDDITVYSIKIENTGTADSEDAISNVELEAEGKTYEATVDGDEFTFNLGGVVIEDEDDLELTLTADIEEDATKTVVFEIIDVVAEDEGSVMLTPTKTGTSTLTIENSEVVVSSNNEVEDEDVAAGSEDVEMASFEIEVTGEDITSDEVVLNIQVSGTEVEDTLGSCSDSAHATKTDCVSPATWTANLKDVKLENIAIYTEDGDMVAGPEDASFTAVDTDVRVEFGKVDFEGSDEEVIYIVKADVNADAPTGTKYTFIDIILEDIETKSGEDVANATDTLGQVQTVEGSALAISIEDAEETELNSDVKDIEVAQIEIDADNSGDDINVTELELAFTVTAATSGAEDEDVKKCELFDGSDSVSSAETADDSVKFAVDIDVEAGETKTLSVKCDIGDEFENTDTVKIALVSYEAKGETTKTNLDADVTGEDTTVTIVEGAGEFKVSSENSNDSKTVLEGENDVVLADIDVEAKDGEVVVEEVVVNIANFAQIDGKITMEINGNTYTENAEAATTFEISETIDKDTTVTVLFTADMEDATGTELVISSIVMKDDATTAVALTDNTAAADFSVITVVTAMPVITEVSSDDVTVDSSFESDVELMVFKIKAEGDDVVIAENSIVFAVEGEDTALLNSEINVYSDSSFNNQVNGVDGVLAQAGTTTLEEITIDENDTYYFVVTSDIALTTGYVSITLEDADGSFAFTPAVNASEVMEDDIKASVDIEL